MNKGMLSIQFSQADKDGMIMALTKHHPDHCVVDELVATLETPGDTVLSATEALILAGLVRLYYSFISDRIVNHPAIGDGKLPTIESLSKIRREAEEELARIERDGGTAGFALRVLEIARGEGG